MKVGNNFCLGVNHVNFLGDFVDVMNILNNKNWFYTIVVPGAEVSRGKRTYKLYKPKKEFADRTHTTPVLLRKKRDMLNQESSCLKHENC